MGRSLEELTRTALSTKVQLQIQILHHVAQLVIIRILTKLEVEREKHKERETERERDRERERQKETTGGICWH